MADVYEIVTSRVIAQIEEAEKNGTELPWKKGWIRPTLTGKITYMPANKKNVAYNATTGKVYSILNQILAGKPGAWATFKQIEALGGRVKKGEKSSPIVFWEMKEDIKTNEETGEEEKKTFAILRYYSVFHIDTQTENVDMKKVKEPVEAVDEYEVENKEAEWNDIEIVENIINAYTSKYSIAVKEMPGDRAFYSPSTDSITVPCRGQFKSREEFYGTLVHEVVHSTGHKSRLDRFSVEKSVAFGDENYAKEELVAEIGAASFCNMYNIESNASTTNNSAYIQSWLKALKNDKKLIVFAAAKAEKALNLILAND